MYRCALPLAIALLLSSLGCTQAPPPVPPDTRAADQKAIADMEAAWVPAWQAKDVDKIVAVYAADAVVMQPDMPAMKGTEAIRAGVKAFVGDKNFALTFAPIAVEVAKSGDIGYTYGTYTATMTSPKTKKPVTEKGKYVTVYKKQADGAWKAFLDTNNADAPAK
jgi:uncharacterized protein (TIGR02246 family)